MRLHADHLTYLDLCAAAQHARVLLETSDRHGSRKRDHAFEVKLEGSGRHMNSGSYGARTDTQGATWDEWGDFLGYLFRQDETLTIPRIYESAEHFNWTTCNRYDGREYRRHGNHRWNFHGFSVGGAYHVQGCKGSKAFGECDAILRRPAYGYTFADLAA